MTVSITITQRNSMNLDEPILGLGRTWPDALYCLKHNSEAKWGCYCHGETHGLALFTEADSAVSFSARLKGWPLEIQEISYEAAIELAKSRPKPVVAIMLLDDLANPLIQWVK